MSSGLVSIIIPTYNRELYIPQCVQSVLDQTYRPLEIIVIDDGSQDGTVEYLKKLERETSCNKCLIFQWRSQKNSGAPVARNLGFSLSTGEYTVFLDSDDILLPEKLENEIQLLSRKNLDVVYSIAQYIGSDGKKLDRYVGRELDGTTDDYFEFSWQTMCATYRSSYIKNIGEWNQELEINQDWEFSIRAIIEGGQIQFVNQVHQYYRLGAENRIGNQINVTKIEGKVLATQSVIRLLNSANIKIDRNLVKKFRKRIFYCLLMLSAQKAASAQNVFRYLQKEGFLSKTWFLLGLLCLNCIVANLLLKIYSVQNRIL